MNLPPDFSAWASEVQITYLKTEAKIAEEIAKMNTEQLKTFKNWIVISGTH